MSSGPEPLDASSPTATAVAVPRSSWLRRTVLYPDLYTWFVFLSSLDLLLTWLILHAGGREVNAIADWVIHQYNIQGLIAFKFMVVVLVLCICEVVGRMRVDLGVRLARWAVVLTSFPVIVGSFHVLRIVLDRHGWGPEF